MTIYCVQTFRRQGKGYERGHLTSYSRKDFALHYGREAAARAHGAMVYEVEVDTGAKTVGRVRVIERYGCAKVSSRAEALP